MQNVDDILIHVIMPNKGTAGWMKLSDLRDLLGGESKPPELTPAMKAAITRAVKKAVRDETG